jgi:hypothetical protein
MKIQRMDWVRLFVWVLLAALIALGWVSWQHAERDEAERLNPGLRIARLRSEQWESDNAKWKKEFVAQNPDLWNRKTTNTSARSPMEEIRTMQGMYVRAQDMSDPERADLGEKFTQQFRPALERWNAAYTNRLPFDLSEVTLDKFNSKLARSMFTFMIGSTTLTFIAPKEGGESAKVGYLMVKQAALDINRLPSKGFVPNLNTPITREEVLRMLKADTGRDFKPSEIIIRPTAKASAMNGGAFVDLLPEGLDPNNGLNYKISMVFNANGKLVNYERDPRF